MQDTIISDASVPLLSEAPSAPLYHARSRESWRTVSPSVLLSGSLQLIPPKLAARRGFTPLSRPPTLIPWLSCHIFIARIGKRRRARRSLFAQCSFPRVVSRKLSRKKPQRRNPPLSPPRRS